MKNETTRTKTLSGFSSRAIALVLCFVMLLTAIGSGSVLSAIAADFEGNGAAVLVDAAKAGADVDAPAAGEAEESSDVLEPEDIDDGFVLTKKGDAYIADTGRDADLAETGDTIYYLHIGVQSAFRTSSGIAFTYDSSNNLYYASYNLINDKEYPMVINTTSGALGDGDKSSSNQTVTSLASSWNPDSIQFDYFQYNTNNYDGYDTFKFKTQTSQTVYFTFASGSSTLIVRSTLPSGGSGSGSGSGSGGTVSSSGKLDAIYFKSNGTSFWQKDNARVKAKVTYSDNTNFKDYMTFIPNSSDTYVLPVDSSKVVSKVQFFRVDPNDETDWNNSNEITVTAGNNLFTYPASKWSDESPTQSTYTTMSGYIPDILGGSRIMFYYGDTFHNGDGNHVKYLNDGSSDVTSVTSIKRDPANDQTGYFNYYDSNNSLTSSSNFEASTACIAAAQYYVSNKTKSSWLGVQMAATAAAGSAYVLTSSSACATGYARGGASFAESGATWDSTNSRYEVELGTAATGITASASHTTSVVNSTNRIFYAYEDQAATGTYYDFNPADASSLPIGTYNIYAIVADGGILVKGDMTVLKIASPPTYAVTVKSNNSRLGTGFPSPAAAYAGQTVTINVSPNMGAFDSISVKDESNNTVSTTTVTAGTTYTFVMPSSAATVNLTFTDYSEPSRFYYNSYETNGNPSSTRYGQQMTEGKIGGQKFSYYHVEGRTGNDQLFTVSYESPVYNSYETFFEVDSSWGSTTPQALFYATDGKNLGNWANMYYIEEKNSKKRYRIAIPDGARSVRFKHGSNETAQLFFTSGKNGWYTNGSMSNLTGYESFNPVESSFYENFNGENKYTDSFNTKGFYSHNASRGESHAYTKPKDLGTSSGDYYIIVLYEGKTYTINGVTRTVDKDPEIIWMPKLPGTEDIDSSEVNVYGKDGPIVIDWNNKTASGATGTSGAAYGYSLIADTKLYNSDETTAIGTDVNDDGASYEKAKVVVTSEDSADIVIKTTISSSYTSKYYLKGWNINGVTYACGNNVKGVNAEDAGSNGVYTMKYTIPAGTEDSSSIEITPIYYLLSSYKTSYSITTVTFYLEGYNTITEKWGDTPYIYPFYGNLNNVDNSFGVYPGQPMVFAAGQYSVEVPVNKNVPIAKEPGRTVVKGITINNGYADHVHRNLVYKWSDHDNDQEHKQTYDYDDFYKIYEECLKNGSEHPNSIIFRIQDEETVFNRSQYGGGKSGQFAAGTSNINISDIATSGNGWELLVNRYDNAVNIFGSHDGISNPGSNVSATTDTENALYVVSTGYNANIAGDYGTMWKIYNGSGELISNAGGRVGVPPSVLLLRGSSSGYSSAVDALNYPSADRSVDGVGSYTDSIDDYEAIYKALHNSDYTNKRVYITYEKDAQDTRKVTSGTGANRLDGRWYYTHKSDTVQSTIGIEYWDNAQNKWVTDSMTGITGSHTGCTAKFNNNSTTSPQYTIENNGTYSFSAAATSGWQFDSWQIKYSETSYDQIATTASATMPATLSYNIVARFVPTTSGDLTINHTLNKASSGEGTVDMEVKVYTDSNKGTLVTDGSKTGSRVYLGETFINNSTAANYVIEITLKTTPIYDGKVSQFTYDKFNTDNSITATTDPVSLPGSENTLTTSTFTIPVSSLYNVGTLKTRELNYTSLIDETLHYYNFTYSFTDRNGDPKTYTSKGVMGKTEYAKIVSDQAAHTLDPSILVDKAPFESNFLKSNTLSKGTISYTNETHTYTAASTFTQNDNVPTYHVVFKLPYSYYNEAGISGGIGYKKYTASSTTYNDSAGTFDLAAKYNTFVTVNATSAVPDTAQTKVDKVTDGSDINHTGNNFITAPEELKDGSTTMYFKYWEIKKLKSDGTAGDDVAKIYYPDFHYRVYSDYYVTAVYSSAAADSWKLNYSEENNTVIDCSVLYLGDSRNQWNDGTKASSADATDAADLIYSDFIFHYTYMGQEIKDSTDDNLEVGMILERATYIDTSDGNKVKWLTGSTSVNDMSYYRANYGGNGDKSTETTRKNAILTALNSGDALPSGTIKATWGKSELNNKNFTEQSYKAYSQYGQTVANDTITFAQDSVIDNYVYRAYAYIKDNNGNCTLSNPVYFSMRYTSNLKYTE